jgi:type II secretory pathway pseudopilin PulG
VTTPAPASGAPAGTAPAASSGPAPARLSALFGNLELVVVILLGIVSVATAFTSFQAALYDGMTASAYSQAQNTQTEAESLYLEANQTFIQDTQTWARLTELTVDMGSADPAVAASAQAKFDNLHFVLVDEAFDAAIAWSNEQSAGADYVGPFESEDYLTARFGAWSEQDQRSEALFADAERFNAHGDRLQLNTVLMAITLFLLGVAAVLKARRMQWTLIGVGSAVFLLALVLNTFVPFVWL